MGPAAGSMPIGGPANRDWRLNGHAKWSRHAYVRPFNITAVPFTARTSAGGGQALSGGRRALPDSRGAPSLEALGDPSAL
jgi:hypothetical protein